MAVSRHICSCASGRLGKPVRSASGQGRYHPDVKDEDPYALLRKSGLWLVRQGLCDGAGFGKAKKMSEEVRYLSYLHS